jgi:hypothetical protein
MASWTLIFRVSYRTNDKSNMIRKQGSAILEYLYWIYSCHWHQELSNSRLWHSKNRPGTTVKKRKECKRRAHEKPGIKIMYQLSHLRHQLQKVAEVDIVDDLALHKPWATSYDPVRERLIHPANLVLGNEKTHTFSSALSNDARAQRPPYTATSCWAMTSV